MNIAAVSNIADLVARAFANNAPTVNNGYKQGGWNDKQAFDRRPTEKLESFSDEVPANQQEESIDDNVIIGSGYSTDGSTTTEVDHGFLGQVLRVLGMDTSKIGAMALNGIIFIAQMVNFKYLFHSIKKFIAVHPPHRLVVHFYQPSLVWLVISKSRPPKMSTHQAEADDSPTIINMNEHEQHQLLKMHSIGYLNKVKKHHFYPNKFMRCSIRHFRNV